MILTELARAKVNLALHVVGRRADGYHLLDTLVAFPPIGDRVGVAPANAYALAVTGPGAAALGDTAPADNLVTRAAVGLAALAGRADVPVAITLEKHLPVAAGLGGGSADAAATLRLLCRLWSMDPADAAVRDLAGRLGADVPMCLASRPLRAAGVGEVVTPIASLPALGILLVNPGVAVPTPAVFRALDRRDNPPLPETIPSDADALLAMLAEARNDLEAPAIRVAPVVADVLAALRDCAGARLARMSGSGATCFALFDHEGAARAAATAVAAAHPSWWARSAALGGDGGSPPA
ncbi:4-(cytidine 5'-diphospho)-2-C-methyl-D-erythritol kinase [Chthonobacter rhizosphaerae]|uniref:4-(cytidine 5'-diphospho)-2-C-methyl-D-erythritol kinase n=1 Tax=Chthonobacter rhizosphaerae TaxID=2735553 RepID=UPI001AEEAAB6|nr:4-(cytidine 5'-diphospho)-2-C-methyl-D-erythritol kinase [Chthonobacter rhizosphaerae]